MGYSYRYNERGSLVLACDNCGQAGGVRKRRCPHKVLASSERCVDGQRHEIDYCPAPALCDDCYRTLRPTLHANCAEGARASQGEYDERQRRLEAGELYVLAAWGDWHDEVPSGMVGVLFGGSRWGVAERKMLVREDDYAPGKRPWLSDYPTAIAWEAVTV
jgi:hypothetical protein